ncbi:hypothetical protein PI124_g15666 [Phytophthora idaei]|nr:hypothetical protein PI124_g15666 [Phytophthora idaei]
MLRKFGQQDFVTGKKKKVQVTVMEDRMHQFTYGHSTVKLSADHFANLRGMFARKQGLGGDMAWDLGRWWHWSW